MSRRCCGITLSGHRCKKTKFKKNNECLIHIPKECSICMNTLKKNYVKLKNCDHFFCKHCIYTWITYNPTCPNCRKDVRYSEITRSLSYGVANGTIITATNYIFNINPDFGEFYDYIDTVFNMDTWFSEEDFEIIKFHITLNGYYDVFVRCVSEITRDYIPLNEYSNEIPYYSYTNDPRKYVTRFLFC